MDNTIIDYRSKIRMNARGVWMTTTSYVPFDKWLEQYHAIRLPVTTDLKFETEEDAVAFILKFK
jgi:hypothetical protein